MRNKIERVLLLILWLLVSALGIGFWFSVYFGFNIFTPEHWAYLGQMQAEQMAVNPAFYISIVVSAIIFVCGIYFILRPRVRKIILPARNTKQTNKDNNILPKTVSTETQHGYIAIPIHQTKPVQEKTEPVSNAPQIPARPPRLNIPTSTLRPTPNRNISVVEEKTVQKNQNREVFAEIFTAGGYILKKTPKIGNLQTELFAIGTNDVLWVGAYGAQYADILDACNKLQQLFDDFLEESFIQIRAFVVNSPNEKNFTGGSIIHFTNAQELRKYILDNPNPPIPDGDKENFDAYSEFITTVAEYIGKI